MFDLELRRFLLTWIVLSVCVSSLSGVAARRFSREVLEENVKPGSNITQEAEWHKVYKECGGERQSPIDIRSDEVQHLKTVHEIIFSYTSKGGGAYVRNNGHSLEISFADDIELIWENLNNPYTVKQLHFHWGVTDSEGSEHRINGKSYPLEMHVVTYDSIKYEDIGEALGKTDSLSVYGVLFELSNEDNKYMDRIVSAIQGLNESDNRLPINGLILTDLLPPHFDTRYYTYSGSLTTPPCSESVVWIVGGEKLTVSSKQLQEFRKLPKYPGKSKPMTDEDRIMFNWREPQKLHERNVYATFAMKKPVAEKIISLAANWHKGSFVFASLMTITTWSFQMR